MPACLRLHKTNVSDNIISTQCSIYDCRNFICFLTCITECITRPVFTTAVRWQRFLVRFHTQCRMWKQLASAFSSKIIPVPEGSCGAGLETWSTSFHAYSVHSTDSRYSQILFTGGYHSSRFFNFHIFNIVYN